MMDDNKICEVVIDNRYVAIYSHANKKGRIVEGSYSRILGWGKIKRKESLTGYTHEMKWVPIFCDSYVGKSPATLEVIDGDVVIERLTIWIRIKAFFKGGIE